MSTNPKPAYRRVLLKLSGEALQGSEGFGIDPAVLERMAQEIKELVELGVQVGLVIGGGNLFRGAGLAKAGMNRVVGDHMGMLATVMNGLAMRDALHRAYVNARLMSAISCKGLRLLQLGRSHQPAARRQGGDLLCRYRQPFFTTDSAACLRGIEIEADVVLKATKVDGVFTDDPVKNPDAVLYQELSYDEVLEKNSK